jgi:hypothetical protein
MFIIKQLILYFNNKGSNYIMFWSISSTMVVSIFRRTIGIAVIDLILPILYYLDEQV